MWWLVHIFLPRITNFVIFHNGNKCKQHHHIQHHLFASATLKGPCMCTGTCKYTRAPTHLLWATFFFYDFDHKKWLRLLMKKSSSFREFNPIQSSSISARFCSTQSAFQWAKAWYTEHPHNVGYRIINWFAETKICWPTNIWANKCVCPRHVPHPEWGQREVSMSGNQAWRCMCTAVWWQIRPSDSPWGLKAISISGGS